MTSVIVLVRQSGLPNETNAMFTNVEGELGRGDEPHQRRAS
jgi:uncharacterized protein YqgV (UPF0045/DUF77 family)